MSTTSFSRLTQVVRTSLIAFYNRLSKVFSRSDTKQTQKRSNFRDQMRRLCTRSKSTPPLCLDCDARTFADWEARSCLSSFDIYIDIDSTRQEERKNSRPKDEAIHRRSEARMERRR